MAYRKASQPLSVSEPEKISLVSKISAEFWGECFNLEMGWVIWGEVWGYCRFKLGYEIKLRKIWGWG